MAAASFTSNSNCLEQPHKFSHKSLEKFYNLHCCKGQIPQRSICTLHHKTKQKQKKTKNPQPDKGTLKKKEMQYKKQSQLQHLSSSHRAKGNTFPLKKHMETHLLSKLCSALCRCSFNSWDTFSPKWARQSSIELSGLAGLNTGEVWQSNPVVVNAERRRYTK